MSSNTIYTFPLSRKKLALLSQEEKNQIFINKAKLKHGDKYDYSLVNYTTAKEKVKIICPMEGHGIFETRATNHLHVRGVCPKCAAENNKIIGIGQRRTLDEFIAESNIVHNNKFDYSLVEYVNSTTKVKIICRDHGVFLQTPHHHLWGSSCKECNAEKYRKKYSIGVERFIEKSTEKHGTFIDYSYVKYKNLRSPVILKCPNHGFFDITPKLHLDSPYACPQCASGTQSSKSNDWLDSLNIPHLIREYRLPENKKKPVDGYDPQTNTVYEFHGKYWHADPRENPHENFDKRRKMTYGEIYTISQIMDMQIQCWGYNLIIMKEFDYDLLGA